jgi:hypothetical protein
VLGGVGIIGATARDAFMYLVMGFWMLVRVVVDGFLQQAKEVYK